MRDGLAGARGGGLLELVEGGEILAPPPQLLLAMLEVPEVEEVAARQEPLVAEKREELLADEDGAETGLRLVQLGLLAEVMQQRVIVERGQERAVQDRRGRDVL